MVIHALFALAAAFAGGEYAKQPVHERVLFGETQVGAYVMSFYNSDMDVVRFRVCGEKGAPFSGDCRPLVDKEFSYKDLPFYEKKLIEKLKAYREKLRAEKSLFKKIVGGPDRDVEALDKVIESLQDEGLRGWILHRRPARGASPNVTTSKALAEILKDAKDVFDREPPRAAPAASGGEADEGRR